jgi:hypothetical protein
VLLLDPILLFVIDGEGVSIEVHSHLFEACVREFLILQNPQEAVFRKPGF